MKKIVNMLMITMLVFLTISTYTLAAEDTPVLPYFGAGANVTEQSDGTYDVKTEGAKENEGFVYSPADPFTSTKVEVHVTLKGKGTVLLQVSETDPRGRFIKDKSMEIQLTEEWATYVLPFELASTASQLDVLIVTKEAEKTEFSFKDLKITNK